MKLLGENTKSSKPLVGTDEVLLEVKNLVTRFPVAGGLLRRTVAQVHAVEDVSFSIKRGCTLALVGESGCGKSTVGRSLLRLVEPLSGEVRMAGKDVLKLPKDELRNIRSDMQKIGRAHV